jgi:hypothetical protein
MPESVASLEKHVPPALSAQLNERYDPADPDALLDVFYPSAIADKPLPTIVWVHGGGWISGSKDDIANYGKVLAGKGYTVVGVDYSLAPGKTFPTPIRQVNAALGYVVKNAERLRVDPIILSWLAIPAAPISPPSPPTRLRSRPMRPRSASCRRSSGGSLPRCCSIAALHH